MTERHPARDHRICTTHDMVPDVYLMISTTSDLPAVAGVVSSGCQAGAKTVACDPDAATVWLYVESRL